MKMHNMAIKVKSVELTSFCHRLASLKTLTPVMLFNKPRRPLQRFFLILMIVYNPQITSSDRKAFVRRGNEQEQHLGGTDLVEGHQEGFRSHEWGTFLKRDIKY